MKKLSIAILFAATLAVSACHYGRNEAHETLERNEQYKNDNKDYSVNRAGEGGKMNESEPAAAATDSTAKAN
jgi:hypothetical protein